jgi:hypothetical protein
VYSYCCGSNAVECQKNSVFTVENILYISVLWPRLIKPSGTGNQKFIDRWTTKLHREFILVIGAVLEIPI